MNSSESFAKLTAALLEAQKEFDPILKDKDNPFFKSKYADLESVVDATQPALQKNGLVVLQFPASEVTANGVAVGVRTVLAHTSGEFITETFTLPVAKQDAQTGAAAVTYARRISRLAVLGIAAEDDDGNSASARYDQDRPAPKNSAKQKNSGNSAREPVAATATSQPSEESAAVKPAISGAGSSEVPSGEELEGLRNRFRLLGDDLATGGLKASANPKITIAQKLKAYLLQTTGATDTSKITRWQWDTFFNVVSGVKKSEGGIQSLVKLVNKAALPQEEA